MGDVTRGRNFSWPTKPCSAVDGWDHDLSGGMYHTIVSEVNLPISFFLKKNSLEPPANILNKFGITENFRRPIC
jgi:hypothetical protein